MSVRIKFWMVAIGLSLIGFTQAVAQDAQAGFKALDAEQINKAKGIFQNLATTAPSADNQFNLGLFYLRTLNAAEAKAAFEKGLSLDPKNVLNNVGLGGVALLNKDRAGAQTLINQALTATKNRDENVLYRAAEMYTLFDETNDPAEAIRLIDLIYTLKKHTPNAEYHMIKGDALYIKNEGGPAISEYEKAIALNPKLAKAFNMIGKVYKRGKNYSSKTNEGGAQNYFQKAVEADSNFAPAYREYGELWLLVRNYKNAAYNYKKYLEKSDPSPENTLRYAKFAFLSKDYDNAVLRLNEIKGKINDPDIQRMYGYSYIEQNNPTLGVENLEQLLKIIPDQKKLSSDYGYLARGYAKLKKDDDALKYLAIAAPLDTNENYYLDQYNILYSNQKKYKEAAEAYKKVMDWKSFKKERVGSNEYLRLGSAYYFAAADARKAKDTLQMVALAVMADSAFAKVTSINAAIPTGFLWRARANFYIDVDRSKGLVIPHYEKCVEVAEKEPAKYKKELVEACKQLAVAYFQKADAVKGLEFANKGLGFDPEDKDLKELVAQANNATTPPATGTPPPPKAGNGAGSGAAAPPKN
jgi:tetratricopeptide (TPR) repeat protein